MKETFKEKAFTLVELLVAMAIIGMLIMLIYAAVGVARRSARDTARKADLQALELELEDFYGGGTIRYPTIAQFTRMNTTQVCVGPVTGSCSGGNVLNLSSPTTTTDYDETNNTVTQAACTTAAQGLPRALRTEWYFRYRVDTAGQNYCLVTHLENGQPFVIIPQN